MQMVLHFATQLTIYKRQNNTWTQQYNVNLFLACTKDYILIAEQRTSIEMLENVALQRDRKANKIILLPPALDLSEMAEVSLRLILRSLNSCVK